MKKQFVVLSKYKLDSYENKKSRNEFIAEDLIDIICIDSSLIITDLEHLNQLKKEYPSNKYEYTITIERKLNEKH